MRISLNKTNSWHWLIMALFFSLLGSAFLFYSINSRISKKHQALMAKKTERLETLSMISEDSVSTVNREIVKFQDMLKTLKKEELDSEYGRMPLTADAVLKITTSINKAIIDNKLRMVEHSLKEKETDKKPLEAAKAGRKLNNSTVKSRKKVKKAAKTTLAPFKTVDYKFKVEGSYKNMFMFLVKQSFDKHSYHIKDIEIINSSTPEMKMNFTVQVNYRK